MHNKIISTLILLTICGSSFAAESSNLLMPTKTISSGPSSNGLTVNNSALSQADNDYNQLNALKRKAQLKDAQDKLNPPKPQVISTSGGSSGGINETTATSVVIDHSGNAFATLQFIDGSTLNVERGSTIGKYTVTDIDMRGVKIAVCSKKCSKPILIKRAYATTPYKQGSATMQVPSQSTNVFAPSNNNTSSSVPPIGGI
jgi:hypothetical protein